VAWSQAKGDPFGASSKRGRKLPGQLELEELEANAAEDAARMDAGGAVVRGFTRARPARRPLPVHLPRERVGIPGLTACPCCGGTLSKFGETVTQTLESVPRQWKVIQTVREKWSCRACATITQSPAPFHPIFCSRADPSPRDGRRAYSWRRRAPSRKRDGTRHHRARAGPRQDGHRPIVDPRARRPALGRAGAAAGGVLLLPRPRGRSPERALHSAALERKSWLLAGGDRGGERAATMYSLIMTAKLNDVDPRA
jgi:transposase